MSKRTMKRALLGVVAGTMLPLLGCLNLQTILGATLSFALGSAVESALTSNNTILDVAGINLGTLLGGG